MAAPAETYHEYLVPAIFARWAPLLMKYALPVGGERVLDVACGTGVMAKKIAPLVGAGGRVVGLDISRDMLEVARRSPAPTGVAIEWVEGSAQTLPAGPFDIVLCQQGLQFFPDPAGAVVEMRRVLADGGRAVVAVWRDLDMQPVFKAIMEAEARILDESIADVALPFTFERREELQPLFERAGFGRVEVLTECVESSFPEPDKFLKLAVLAAAAVIPTIAEMSDEARDELVRQVADETAPVLARHRRGANLVFEMHSNLIVAQGE